MKSLEERLTETAAFLGKGKIEAPGVAIILGSGLAVLAERISSPRVVPYSEIPHFTLSTVEGHPGRLVFGELAGRRILAMQGRFHYYEGYDMGKVTYPVRLMQELGVKVLIVTNAAGGVNTSFSPGDLMLIRDHINLMGANPLTGGNFARQGPRFPDMSEAYAAELRSLARKTGETLGIALQEGVYAGVSGPSYETPAEIRFLRVIGADAVGMSTVPEVIVANHAGLKVLGISCITNMAAGVLEKRLDHDEVMETAARVKEQFSALVAGIVQDMGPLL
jgi:purine-nucleoside phosphorylase